MTRQLALVTGASSGIGFSLAKELRRPRYDLVICAESDRLQSKIPLLEETGVEIYAVQENLADAEGVSRLWEKVEKLGRPLDIACLNAGVGVGGLFSETNLDDELNMVQLNCAGTVQLAKYVVRQTSARKQGRILFTASIAARWSHREKLSTPRRRLSIFP